MLLFPGTPAPGERLRAPARGFTLIELVVVAALASILFTVLVRWVLTLAAASTNTLDNASSRRIADVAMDTFSEDIRSARVCQAGASSPLSAIGPASVTFLRTSDVDPSMVQMVTWTVAPTAKGAWSLTRAATADQSCTSSTGLTVPFCSTSPNPASTPTGSATAAPSGSSSASVCRSYADAVVPVQTDRILAGDSTVRPAFYTLLEGQQVADPQQAWGKCTDGATADRCFATAVGLNWSFVSPSDGGAPVSLSRLFTFPTSTAGVS